MPPAHQDRNLLFGILAAQLDFISHDALLAAMNAWVMAKHKTLSQILREHGVLGQEECTLLEALVAKHVEKHGDNAQNSLGALTSASPIAHELANLADADVQASLQMVCRTSANPGKLAADETHAQSEPPVQPGLRYQILRPHAEGGLGQVYVARDSELHREVALKEIKARYADDLASRARFLQEAEITGGLEHPGVVPVYGLGQYGDGRPFYAMRFIRGDSLQEALERFHGAGAWAEGERAVQFRQLLKRFLDVCNAVAYAHSRGVLHRDLKPGNIMLGRYGETLVVDWGLAKVVARENASKKSADQTDGLVTLREQASALVPRSKSQATEIGQAVGTPAFMSPEQAQGKLDKLGPATDVYSLGAILYVVLTGKPAFAGDAGDVFRRVERGEFTPPRQIDVGVPAALDAICCKAMATRPTDRYATPLDLAADLEHWLADEPVTAYPEPTMAQAARWARKHRTLVTGAAAALLVGTAALGTATILLQAANSRERSARELAVKKEREANEQRDLAEQARRSEETQRKLSEAARDIARQRYQLALDAFNTLVFGIQNKLASRPATEELRRMLLENARSGLGKLVDSADSQHQEADSTLVWAHLQMGDVYSILGATADARSEYEKGHALAQKIAASDPATSRPQRDLMVSYNRLGDIFLKVGSTEEALRAYRKALDIARKLADTDPKGALPRVDLSLSHGRLGNVLLQLGDTKGALQAYRDGLEISKKLAASDPANPQVQHELSIAQRDLGNALLLLGDSKGALEAYHVRLDIAKKLAAADPANSRTQRELCYGYERLGKVLLQVGDANGALAAYREALGIARKLALADPTSTEAQRDLSFGNDRLGNVLLELGDTKGAFKAYQDALATARKLSAADPANSEAQGDLCASERKVGNVLLQMGDAGGARKLYLEALDLARKLASADPANSTAQGELAVCYERFGNALLQLGDAKGALQAYRSSLELDKKLAAADPASSKAQSNLGDSQEKIGDALMQLGDAKGALEAYRAGLDIRKKLFGGDPSSIQAQRDLSFTSGRLGDANLKLGDDVAALAAYRESLEIARKLVASDPSGAQSQRALLRAYAKMGNYHEQHYEFSEAVLWYDKALDIPRHFANGEFFAREVPALQERLDYCRETGHAVSDLAFALGRPKDEVPRLLYARMRALRRKGDVAGMAATAEAFGGIANNAAGSYNAACAWALCAAAAKASPTDADLFAAKSLVWLRKAVALGYRNLDQIKHDPDLDALRSREAYQQFIRELQEQKS